MGTDITAQLEIHDGTNWQLIGSVELHRDYDLFGVLADVRQQAVDLDGLPCVGHMLTDLEDVSKQVRKQIEQDWWHDAVQLTPDEFRKAAERVINIRSKAEGKDMSRLITTEFADLQKCMNLFDKIEEFLPDTPVRLICLFDS